MNLVTRRMAQDELAALEQHTRLERFHTNINAFIKQSHNISEGHKMQVKKAVLDASARMEHGIWGCAAQHRLAWRCGNEKLSSTLEAKLEQR